mgnify:CR=1 FL=1
MSVREFSPLFSWGFSLRKSKWLIPLFNNNVFSFGHAAAHTTSGTRRNRPLGLPTTQQRHKSTLIHTNNNNTKQSTSNNIKRDVHALRNQSANESNSAEQALEDFAVQVALNEATKRLEQESQLSSDTPCVEMKKIDISGLSKEAFNQLSDGELYDLINQGKMAHYELENKLEDKERAVRIRRMYFAGKIDPERDVLVELPYEQYNYDQVYGVNCENVIGYVPIPIGAVGPVLIDGKEYIVPMATTEGCLVASTHRGAKALSYALEGSIQSVVLQDGMTRGPAIELPSAKRAG